MFPFRAPTIRLSSKQEKILTALQRGIHSPLHWKQRATIIALAAQGQSNQHIAEIEKLNRNTVTLWRKRWARVATEIRQQELQRPRELKTYIRKVLEDAP